MERNNQNESTALQGAAIDLMTTLFGVAPVVSHTLSDPLGVVGLSSAVAGASMIGWGSAGLALSIARTQQHIDQMGDRQTCTNQRLDNMLAAPASIAAVAGGGILGCVVSCVGTNPTCLLPAAALTSYGSRECLRQSSERVLPAMSEGARACMAGAQAHNGGTQEAPIELQPISVNPSFTEQVDQSAQNNIQR